MSNSQDSDHSVLSIHSVDSDDLPMVEAPRSPSPPKRRRLVPPQPTLDEPRISDSSESDDDIEDESIHYKFPVLRRYLTQTCADVDMLVYAVSHVFCQLPSGSTVFSL
jgi:hypothetical protein